MSASARLRELADAATPGPWENRPNIVRPHLHNVHAPNKAYGLNGLLAPVITPEDARLIALAPDLARWAAEAAEVIDRDWSNRACTDPDCPCDAGKVSALLADLGRIVEGEQG